MTNTPKRKILLFADWYYPAFKAGGPVQSCHNIAKMLGHQYQFYVVTSDRDLGDTQPYAGISTTDWVDGNDGEKIRYLYRNTMNPGTVRKIMHEVQPDVIYFNSMFSLLYTLMPLWVLQRMRFGGRVVLAPRGMLHAGALMRKSVKKTIFLRTFWLSGWPGKMVFHATDAQEQKDVKRYFRRSKQVVLAENIPNTDPDPLTLREKEKDTLRLVFISRLHAKKNLHLLLELLRQHSLQGSLSLDVYGEAEDPEYERKCRQTAAGLPGNITVTFRGPLPHNLVFGTLHQYHLFVLPTLGENFGHAIFEALSSGTPVLISDKTPWSGLAARKAGWEIPLKLPEQYLQAIREMLAMDQQEYREWSAGALAFSRHFLESVDIISKYRILFQ
ncbi:MAG: glycosyltransferase family 4 protein [Candidatus Pseudobacter hemicellulosilyticus]|uniref:Glycosyltransferase family 4 protein n=1 Tax=Candidatus Pseudobacter hemicellulosilyticus TaxID=3121375 RepID=A0AAJ5WYB2_9BACT|nr:MAG: glycosyltransferase family 4 protein [Pseudobacter sp.]